MAKAGDGMTGPGETAVPAQARQAARDAWHNAAGPLDPDEHLDIALAAAFPLLLAELRATEGDLGVAVQVAAERADKIAAAEKLHAPKRLYPEARFAPWCGECSTGITTHSDDGSFTHKVSWPCPTAKALGLTDPLVGAATGTKGDTDADDA